MNLQKEKLVPLLEMMGYTTIAGTGVWKKQHEDSTKQIFWGVDFRKNEVFKWVEDHREYDVPGDRSLKNLRFLLMVSVVRMNRKQKFCRPKIRHRFQTHTTSQCQRQVQ
jgi:hypothetical protein